MAYSPTPVQPYTWLDKLDEEFDDCITVPNGGYETERSDTITIRNPGALTGTINSGLGGVTLNSGAGVAGQVLTGGAGTGWAYPNTVPSNGAIYTTATGTAYQQPWASTSASGKLNLNGDEADLVINGKSLTDTIAKLEERLNILTPNPKLEEDWEELRAIGDKYRELERHINAKLKTFETLKRYDEPK